MTVNGQNDIEKVKNIAGNVMAVAIGYGTYCIVDEFIRQKMPRLYFNKSLIGKFSIGCVEVFTGLCAWEYSKKKLSKIL